MITTWMLYAALISALVGIAALALERVAAVLKVPMRFVWLAAMILSVAWPLMNGALRLMPERTTAVRVVPFTISLEPTRVIADGSLWAQRAVLIDRGLLALWVAISVILIARLSQAVITLRRTRSEWRATTIDGTPVRLSSNIGPAVVGLRSMDVVLPEWIMTLDAPLRAIVLRHEEEHRAARDPYLLFVAAVAVALMPWNIALWLQARRLRLAIEMDCDARVLRAHPSPERYGLLMLTIAQRRSVAPPMFAPMLSEPTSQLERRILAMRTTSRRLARATVIGGTVVAVSVLLFACALQSENPVSPKPLGARLRSLPTAMNDSMTYFEFQVEKPVAVLPTSARPQYPAELRAANIEGEVLAQFVVDTFGRADMSHLKVLKSSHDLFTASVLAVLPMTQFTPADVGGRKVKQLVQMPFQFNLSGSTTQTAGAITRPAAAVRGSAVSDKAAEARKEYKEFSITSAATPKAGSPSPRYPAELRAANIEGEVLAQFVVDENGAVVPSTFKVLRTTDTRFSDAVREALPEMRFNAALVGSHSVKQLITMPFTFNLSK